MTASKQPQTQKRIIDTERIAALTTELLGLIGDDPHRPGLLDTPLRVAKFWNEFINYQDNNMETQFESVVTDQMALASGIRGWSLCEHHLLPFSFTAHVAYVPGEKIIGLSKIPRIVKYYSRRLQLQERLAQQISDCLSDIVKPAGVAVVLTDSVHTCAVMRGIEAQGMTFTSSVMKGVFMANPAARHEFFDLLKIAKDGGR